LVPEDVVVKSKAARVSRPGKSRDYLNTAKAKIGSELLISPVTKPLLGGNIFTVCEYESGGPCNPQNSADSNSKRLIRHLLRNVRSMQWWQSLRPKFCQLRHCSAPSLRGLLIRLRKSIKFGLLARDCLQQVLSALQFLIITVD
jgi:hypothetical protein